MALQEFDHQITKNQLYYHTREHINKVQHRANIIFQTIRPYWEASLEDNHLLDDMTRMHLLLDLCAVGHDLVQIFLPQTELHTSRRREAGVSETLTIERLFDYIKCLNQQIQEDCLDDSALFTEADLLIIQEAIAATICTYDPDEQAIYQPALYDDEKPLSPVARILALADISSLGMEGVDSYNQEGSLLLLEENPDIIPILLHQENKTLAIDNSELLENIRQRLLKRARFQVNFAKSRLKRYPQEVASFPTEAIPILNTDVFRYLTPETVQEIESMTPTSEDTNLEVLVDFFKFMSNQ